MFKLFDSYWGWFTLAGIVAFAIGETSAFILRKPDEYTFSAWVWRHIGTRDGWRGWHIPARLAVLAFLLWLAEHFTFGWF